MRVAGISLIGWLHTIACITALVLGAMNLVAATGTTPHKRRGTGYTAAMVVAMVLSLFIFRFDIPLAGGKTAGPGVFGLFHWLAIAALFFTLVGYYAASRQSRGLWAYTHPISMTLSYSLLVGGLMNELFARVDVLRPLAFITVHGKLVFGSRDVQMTQFAVDVATLIVVILFCVKVKRYRRALSSVARDTRNIHV
ncbi:MAG: hypothetical protein ACRD5K_12610 [Candidatus Acidiferrales bacterium]